MTPLGFPVEPDVYMSSPSFDASERFSVYSPGGTSRKTSSAIITGKFSALRESSDVVMQTAQPESFSTDCIRSSGYSESTGTAAHPERITAIRAVMYSFVRGKRIAIRELFPFVIR